MASSESVQIQSLGEAHSAARRPWATPRVIAAVDARSARVKNATGDPDIHSPGNPNLTTVYS